MTAAALAACNSEETASPDAGKTVDAAAVDAGSGDAAAAVDAAAVDAAAIDASPRTDAAAVDAAASPIDCSEAAPQTLCVPSDSEVLLYGSSPPDVLNMQLYRSRPDATETVQLTPDGTMRSPTDFNSYGARSPDRQLIAYVSGRDLIPSRGSPSRGLIYLAPADGKSESHRLTSAPVGCQESMPRFSPDGAWVMFVRSCGSDPVAANTEFLFRIRPDGTDEQRLVHPDRTGADSAILWGTFSRDGTKVYGLVDARVGPFESASNILVAYDLATGAVTELVNFESEGAWVWGHPLELADGDLLYLYRRYGETSSVARLERVHPDGSGRTPVRDIDITENDAVVDFRFAISPSGDRLAYVHDESPTSTTLWVSDIDGSNAIQVGQLAAIHFWMTWNP